MSIHLNVNGEKREFGGSRLTPLLDVLRESFFLTGTKDVCREGFCGACTVHVDGEAMTSCLVPVGMAESKSIVTIEGIGDDGKPALLQQALEALDAVQCGMCFPGMVMTLTQLISEQPAASREDIKRGLAGNICRCTGYERIVDAALTLCEIHEARG